MIKKFLSTFVLSTIFAASVLSSDELELILSDSVIDRENVHLFNSYSKVLDEATPSVVSVYTAKIVKFTRSRSYSPEEEMLRRFFGVPIPRNNNDSVPEERRIPQGAGSGVIVSSDGYILTNNHVVSTENGEDADEILVRLNDGRELDAFIVGRDPLTDVAVLKVEADALPSITISDSDNTKVGDIVFAIGNPMSVGLTVTQGIISATNRSIGIYGENGYENFIQTDASINPGNSGGALIDSQGRLIGINSAILSRSGGNIGIGFAIPSNLAVRITQQLVQFGEVRRAFLGVNISELTQDIAEAFEFESAQGVLVNEVESKSAAEQGGLKRGDIILELDGKPVSSVNDFRIRVGHSIPGSDIKVKIVRDGKSKELKIKVGNAGGRYALNANELVEGVFVEELNDDNSDTFRIPDSVDGLIVVSVEADSPFSRYLREGMVIIEINDEEVLSLQEARDRIKSGANKLYVYNRGRVGYLAIRIE